MRCNSVGNLYPVSSSTTSFPFALVTLSPDFWHNHLGNPGNHAPNFLRTNKHISCNEGTNPSVCYGFQLGKHCRLSFPISHDKTYAPFDIINTDLYTYPLNFDTTYCF